MAAKKTRTSTRKTTVGQNTVISTIEWFGTLVVLIVPILGIVLYFIWAFGSGVNPNRRNYCRAALILMAISLVLGILFSVVLGGFIRMVTGGFGGLW
jgi:ABC-type multidrug transport system permease subunit